MCLFSGLLWCEFDPRFFEHYIFSLISNPNCVLQYDYSLVPSFSQPLTFFLHSFDSFIIIF
jgi:hypothetical protein